MPMSHRFGSYARPGSMEAIEAFADAHKVSRAALTEILVMGLAALPPEQVAQVIAAGNAWIATHKVDKRKKRGNLLAELHKYSADELEALLKNAPSPEKK